MRIFQLSIASGIRLGFKAYETITVFVFLRFIYHFLLKPDVHVSLYKFDGIHMTLPSRFRVHRLIHTNLY